MIHLKTPNGFNVQVPENKEEDDTPRFDINLDGAEALKYYNNNGYVIFNNCISQNKCEIIRGTWEKNIKPYKGTIYRQTTAKAEKNLFNKNICLCCDSITCYHNWNPSILFVDVVNEYLKNL